MKHIFILNPAAGSRDSTGELKEKILKASEKTGIPAELYFTEGTGDAERYVKERLTRETEETLRFYACGGDGTLCETVNGAYGFPNAEVACVPNGSGNDFVRNFSGPENFRNMEAQLLGRSERIDLIRYNGRYCVNMLNIGFDASVVAESVSLKKKKGFSGGLAYLGGIFIALTKKYGLPMSVSFNGKEPVKGNMLLCAVANGGWCGGGFHSAADASLNDGSFNAYLIHRVSRLKFLTLLPKYRTGTYIHVKDAHTFIDYEPCQTLTLQSEAPVTVSCDGELCAFDRIDISMVPEALSFSVPRGSAMLNSERKEENTP